VCPSVGLQGSEDRVCTWAHVFPSAELAVPALAQDPSRPNRAYLSTFGPGEGAIRLREDGAQTFPALLGLPDSDYVLSLRVAPGKPDRVYAAGSTFEPGK